MAYPTAASHALWLIVQGLNERRVSLQSCICGLPVAEEYDTGEPVVCEHHRMNGGGPLNVRPPRLLRNAARCTSCNTILESKHTYDYQGCACGNAVDGGLDYPRRVGCPEELEELSEWEER